VATVAQITAAYENYLLPVLPDQSGVCLVCGTSVVGDFPRCWQCGQAREALDRRADVVVPIALAVKGGQLAHELSAYKNSSSTAARARLRVGLAAVLWRWLALHEECMAQAVGVESVPIVTNVPSTSGRTDEPVQEMVERIVGVTRDRYESLLVANKVLPAVREARPDRFTTSRALSGEAVLLTTRGQRAVTLRAQRQRSSRQGRAPWLLPSWVVISPHGNLTHIASGRRSI
jgi:vacuolar-type H+-ATPase subunit F/Vma7